MGETTRGRNDSGRKGKWAKRLRGERESGRNDPDSNGDLTTSRTCIYLFIYIKFFYQRNNSKVCFTSCRTFQSEYRSSSATFLMKVTNNIVKTSSHVNNILFIYLFIYLFIIFLASFLDFSFDIHDGLSYKLTNNEYVTMANCSDVTILATSYFTHNEFGKCLSLLYEKSLSRENKTRHPFNSFSFYLFKHCRTNYQSFF